MSMAVTSAAASFLASVTATHPEPTPTSTIFGDSNFFGFREGLCY